MNILPNCFKKYKKCFKFFSIWFKNFNLKCNLIICNVVKTFELIKTNLYFYTFFLFHKLPRVVKCPNGNSKVLKTSIVYSHFALSVKQNCFQIVV